MKGDGNPRKVKDADVSSAERHHAGTYHPDPTSDENELEHDERVQVPDQAREARREALRERQPEEFPLGEEGGAVSERWNVPDTSKLDKAAREKKEYRG